MPSATEADRPPGLQWDFTRDGFYKGAAALGAFAALYTGLTILGLTLHENTEALTIVWPSAGLLFMALWLSPARNWIWILAVQLIIEFAVGSVISEHYRFPAYIQYAIANSVDGIVGASVASRLIPTPRIPRLRNVLLFIACVAIGAAAGAVIGAAAITRTFGGPEYVRELQLWWAGNWLGSLCIAPIVMGWAIRWRARQHSGAGSGHAALWRQHALRRDALRRPPHAVRRRHRHPRLR